MTREEMGRMLLLEAGKFNPDNDLILSLIDRGAPLDYTDPDRNTALMWTVYWKNTAVADVLIHKGANIEQRDSFLKTPLMWAAEHGMVTTVALLLEKGADLDKVDEHKKTASDYALRYGFNGIVNMIENERENRLWRREAEAQKKLDDYIDSGMPTKTPITRATPPAFKKGVIP